VSESTEDIHVDIFSSIRKIDLTSLPCQLIYDTRIDKETGFPETLGKKGGQLPINFVPMGRKSRYNSPFSIMASLCYSAGKVRRCLRERVITLSTWLRRLFLASSRIHPIRMIV
jgi:hypothetical protein